MCPRAPEGAGTLPRPGKYVVLYFYPLDFTFVCPVRPCDRAAPARGPAGLPVHRILLRTARRQRAERPRGAAALRCPRLYAPPAGRADGDHRVFGPHQGLRGRGCAGARLCPRPLQAGGRGAVLNAPRPPPLGTRRAQLLGCSIDSKFSHLAFVNTPRNKGGLGGIAHPLLADVTKSISKDYGVLIEEGGDAGIALRRAPGLLGESFLLVRSPPPCGPGPTRPARLCPVVACSSSARPESCAKSR